MALFAAARQSRRDDAELGKGVWRRAHDRFRRGLDRYHQILGGVQDDELYNALVPVADELAALLPRVRAVCMAAQRQLPSEGADIPGSLIACHRALTRAGNALATAAEAAAIARLEYERERTADAGIDTLAQSVRRRAAAVAACIDEAEADIRNPTERNRP